MPGTSDINERTNGLESTASKSQHDAQSLSQHVQAQIREHHLHGGHYQGDDGHHGHDEHREHHKHLLHGHVENSSYHLHDVKIHGADEHGEHRVRKGETLYSIAKRDLPKGSTQGEISRAVQQIVDVNNIKNPNLIFPNQMLHIPDILLKHHSKPNANEPARRHEPSTRRTDNPTRRTEEPTRRTEATTRPGDEDRTPVDTNQKPGDQVPKPVDANQKPSDQNTQPVDANQKPGDQNPKPVDTNQKPGDPAQTSKSEVSQMSQQQCDKAAQDIHDAAFHQNFDGYGWNTPQCDPIKVALGTMNQADRETVKKAYETKFNTKMQDDLNVKFGGDPVANSEINALMSRTDGKADDAGNIHTALAKLSVDGKSGRSDSSSDSARAEGEIRNSLASMNAKQVAELRDTYQKNYGVSLDQALSTERNLSDDSKNALGYYLRGNDNRTPDDTAKLAEIGLSSHRLAMFQEAMQYAAPSDRQAFLSNGGQNKINQAFSGGDAQIANDYAKQGYLGSTTVVNGDHHWYHTNRSDIGRAVDGAQPDEKAQFQLGKKGADSRVQPQNDAERQAVNFYRQTEKAFHDAGNKREAQLWTAKLNGSESVVTNILQTQHDGFLGMGKGHDKNALYASIEDLNQQDWQSLKKNPEHVKNVDKALQTISDDGERNRLTQMLRDKLGANTYSESQNVGRRPVVEALQDAGSDTNLKATALLHLSTGERESYRTNAYGFADNLNKIVDRDMKSDGANVVAHDILKQVQDGKVPELTALDKVAIASEKTDDALKTTTDIESAFKADPTLLERIKNPQTSQDQQLQRVFRGALGGAINLAGLGFKNHGRGGYTASQYPDFAKTLLDTGHLPIEQKMQLAGDDKQQRFFILQTATPEEKAALLNSNPDARGKNLQDSVLGEGAQRQLSLDVLKQGKMTDADQFRAYALGDGGDSSALLQRLDQMTPQQKQDLSKEYFDKFGSLVGEDVVSQAKPSEKFRFTEQLQPADQNIRQVALDARVEKDRHTSTFDNVMRNRWDYSGVAAQDNAHKLDTFVAQHADEIFQLPPKQRKQFTDAVDNYTRAQQSYIDSKGAAAESVVDAAITVAAIGGSVFTGGTSLALLGAIGAGGATFRLGAMRVMEGSDFDSSFKGMAEQAFKGSTSAMLGFIGPEVFGVKGMVAVGEGVAARTVSGVFQNAAKAGIEQSAYRGGEEAAQQVIKDGVSALTRREAIAGGESTEAAIQKMAERALTDAATPEQKRALEQAIDRELKAQVTSNIREKLINEGEAAFMNAATASGANVVTELASTAIGLSDPKTLMERMEGAAISGAAGATIFHFAFKAASAGFHGLNAVVGRDPQGLFAGDGTNIRHADGTQTVVKADEKYRFRDGDQVVEQEKIDKSQPDQSNQWRSQDSPGRFNKNFTDAEGRTWSRNTYSDSTWRAADGSTFTRSNGKEAWEYSDGRRRVKNSNGEEFNYDPKTGWKDTEGSSILHLQDRQIITKTDGSFIERLNNGTTISRSADGLHVEIKSGDKVSNVEYRPKTNSKNLELEISKVTRSDGLVMERVDSKSFRNVQTGKIIDAIRLDGDGNLISEGGLDETTFSPDGSISRRSSSDIFQLRGSKQPSENFIKRVDSAFLHLPPEIRQLLKNKGIRMIVGDSIPDVDPSMKGVEPQGHGPGAKWDHVEGYYSSRDKIAVTTEFREDRNSGKQVATDRAEGVMRHEVGHAIDDALGGFSQKAAFRDSYAADKANFDKVLTQEQKAKLDYFLQKEQAGPSEAFAELFGILQGGGAAKWNEQLIRKAFPNSIKAIDERLEKLKQTGN